MNILYISTLCSDLFIKELFQKGLRPQQSIQKFNSLLVNGFIRNGCVVNAISDLPINNYKLLLYKRRNETEKGIKYNYCFKISIKFLSNVSVFLSSFLMTLFWCHFNKKNSRVAIFDVLKVSICLGSMLACKIMNVKTVAIVTDVPGTMINSGNSIFTRISEYVNNKYINYFDLYILLTEHMNNIVNLCKKPYIIMEGLVDIDLNYKRNQLFKNKKIIMYAGGLFEEYGLKKLIQAFKKISDSNIELHLYGSGKMLDEIVKNCSEDNRIKYFGVLPNNMIVQAEVEATLLINPRPTIEKFAYYSFPSKNIEYMLSGTPVLTTKLQGMPKEYYDFVYLLEDETENGIYMMLEHLLLNTSTNELEIKGKNAKQFVLENKNNILQAKRIIDFISNN